MQALSTMQTSTKFLMEDLLEKHRHMLKRSSRLYNTYKNQPDSSLAKYARQEMDDSLEWIALYENQLKNLDELKGVQTHE